MNVEALTWRTCEEEEDLWRPDADAGGGPGKVVIGVGPRSSFHRRTRLGRRTMIYVYGRSDRRCSRGGAAALFQWRRLASAGATAAFQWRIGVGRSNGGVPVEVRFPLGFDSRYGGSLSPNIGYVQWV